MSPSSSFSPPPGDSASFPAPPSSPPHSFHPRCSDKSLVRRRGPFSYPSECVFGCAAEATLLPRKGRFPRTMGSSSHEEEESGGEERSHLSLFPFLSNQPCTQIFFPHPNPDSSSNYSSPPPLSSFPPDHLLSLSLSLSSSSSSSSLFHFSVGFRGIFLVSAPGKTKRAKSDDDSATQFHPRGGIDPIPLSSSSSATVSSPLQPKRRWRLSGDSYCVSHFTLSRAGRRARRKGGKNERVKQGWFVHARRGCRSPHSSFSNEERQAQYGRGGNKTAARKGGKGFFLEKHIPPPSSSSSRSTFRSTLFFSLQ